MAFTKSSSFPSFMNTQPDNPLADNNDFKTRTSGEAMALLNYNVVGLSCSDIDKLIDSDEFKRHDWFVYNDENGNKIWDEGEIKNYCVTLYYGMDAIKLKEISQSVTPGADELLIFIENQTDDVLSGRKVFLRYGTNVLARFEKNISNSNVVAEIVRKAGTGTAATGDRVVKMIKAQFGKVNDVSEFQMMLQFMMGNVLDTAEKMNNFIMDIPIGILGSISKELRSWEFMPVHWDPTTATPDKPFEPYFFPFVQFNAKKEAFINVGGNKIDIQKLEKSIEDGIEKLFNGVNDSLDQKYKDLLEVIENIGLGLFELEEPDHSPLYRLINLIKDTLKTSFDILVQLATEGLLFYNALLCGFVNSIIEIFVGIFELIKLIFIGARSSTNFLLKMGDWDEYVDNLIQAVEKIDLLDIMLKINDISSEIILRLGSAVWDYIGSLSTADIGYFIGFLIGFIVEQVLEALFTAGIGNAASIARKAGQGFKAIMDIILKIITEAIEKTGKTIVKMGDDIYGAIADFIRFIGKGTENFIKFLDDIGRAILDWLDEMAGIPKSVIHRYSKKYTTHGGLSDLVSPQQALKLHGKGGKKVVEAVDKGVKTAKKLSSKERNSRVMVAGMIYQKGSKTSQAFVKMNYIEKEIGTLVKGRFIDDLGEDSVYQKFLDGMHPLLQKRYKEHLDTIKRRRFNVDMEDVNKNRKEELTYEKLVERAGMIASHGEIRALDAVLKSINKSALTDDIFKYIYGYNRFLRTGASKVQPRCLHCFYLSDGVTMIF